MISVNVQSEWRVRKLVRKKGKVLMRIDGDPFLTGSFVLGFILGTHTHLSINGKLYKVLGVSFRNGILTITLEVDDSEAEELAALIAAGLIDEMKPSRVQAS